MLAARMGRSGRSPSWRKVPALEETPFKYPENSKRKMGSSLTLQEDKAQHLGRLPPGVQGAMERFGRKVGRETKRQPSRLHAAPFCLPPSRRQILHLTGMAPGDCLQMSHLGRMCWPSPARSPLCARGSQSWFPTSSSQTEHNTPPLPSPTLPVCPLRSSQHVHWCLSALWRWPGFDPESFRVTILQVSTPSTSCLSFGSEAKTTCNSQVGFVLLVQCVFFTALEIHLQRPKSFFMIAACDWFIWMEVTRLYDLSLSFIDLNLSLGKSWCHKTPGILAQESPRPVPSRPAITGQIMFSAGERPWEHDVAWVNASRADVIVPMLGLH